MHPPVPARYMRVYVRAHGLSVRIMGLIICYNKTVESSRQPLIPGEKPRRKLPPVNHSGRPAAPPQSPLPAAFPPGQPGQQRPQALPTQSVLRREGGLFYLRRIAAQPVHCHIVFFSDLPQLSPVGAAPSGPPVGHHIAAFVAKRPGKFRIRPMPVRGSGIEFFAA